MDLVAYEAVRSEDRVGYKVLDCGMIKVSGRDRLSFLQGQVSNDVASLVPGTGARACLLNNTGHLLADLIVYAFDGHVIIETDTSRTKVVIDTLNRFVIREKVLLEDVSDRWSVVTLQGGGASRAWEHVEGTATELGAMYSHAPVPFTATDGSSHGEIVKRRRVGASDGYDLWLPTSIAAEILAALPAVVIDDVTYQALRIEVGEPAWGAELTEFVIPLEADLYEAVSFSKGCYMGQEIIARINSRGHTNRTLSRFDLEAPAATGDKIVGGAGPREGEEVGWLTSVAVSPRLGPIALGYVRNEYAEAGASVLVNGVGATVAADM